MGLVGDDDDGRFLLGRMRPLRRRALAPRALPGGGDAVHRLLQFAAKRPAHAFLSSGRRGASVARHFDFCRTQARHSASRIAGRARDDGRALGRATRRAGPTVLRKARARGLKTNLEMVSTGARAGARFGRSCLPHLDCLIVNDYEIGCVADVETREGARRRPARRAALRAALDARRRCELAVAHFPEGAIAATRDGRVSRWVRSRCRRRDRRRQRRGRRLRRRHALWLARGMAAERSLELGHACAAASMRAGVDDARRRAGRRMPRAGRKITAIARRRLVSSDRGRLDPLCAAFAVFDPFIRHGETEYNRGRAATGPTRYRAEPKGREQASAVGRALGKLCRPKSTGSRRRASSPRLCCARARRWNWPGPRWG